MAICLIIFSLNLFAQDPSEPKWKMSLRTYISKYFGESWSEKLFGADPNINEAKNIIEMPKIPKINKKSTSVDTYSKKPKELTSFDKLSADKKRQFDFNFLQELFLVTRKTEAKDDEISNWLNTLEQGGSREGVYQALVLDEVYYNLEGMQDKPTQKLLNFYIEFSSKFLNQGLKPDSISKFNLFSLKRILTEKSLDVMEHFEITQVDNLYKWYANFSADSAVKFSEFMQSEVRKNRSAQIHYQWAKDMPIQHIKSEFIIKIHTIMNELQKLKD